jgi:hypothetical protein
MRHSPYEPFEQLIASLRNDGLLKEAERVHQTIHEVAWTTGSELLGELGMAIKSMRKESPPGLSDESKKKMREAMRMVKRAWPRFPE